MPTTQPHDSEPHQYSDHYDRVDALLDEWRHSVQPSEKALVAELTGLARQCLALAVTMDPPPDHIVEPTLENRQLTALLDYRVVDNSDRFSRRARHTVSAETAACAMAAATSGVRLQALWTVALRIACEDAHSTGEDGSFDVEALLTFSLHYAASTALNREDLD